MRTLANAAYVDAVTDEELLAAGAGRAVRLLRFSVSAAAHVIVKVGAMVLIAQDFPAGRVFSEEYTGGLSIEPGDAVTVTTAIDGGGEGTTRFTLLGD